jgi:hypothetical protein
MVSLEHGKACSLSLQVLQNAADGRLDIGSWDFVHLVAAIHGTYYSIRMIQQIIDFVAERLEGELPTSMSELRTHISYLPFVCGFPSIRDLASMLHDMKDANGIACLSSLCENFEDISAQIACIMNPAKKRNPKAKARRRSHGSAIRLLSSNNPFAILGDEL